MKIKLDLFLTKLREFTQSRRILVRSTLVLIALVASLPFLNSALKTKDFFKKSQAHLAAPSNRLQKGEVKLITTTPELQNDKQLPNVAPGKILVRLKSSNPDSFLASVKSLGGVKIKRAIDNIEEPQVELDKYKQKFSVKNPAKAARVDEKKFLSLNLANIYQLELNKGVSIDKTIEEVKKNPDVEAAEPIFLYKTSFVPNDQLYPEQWSHKITQAEAGWDIERGNKNVIIAIVDTGVDVNHEDLKANIDADCSSGCPEGKGYDFVDIDTQPYLDNGFELIPEEDYVTPDNLPGDFTGHGTHVAGIVAAVGNNGVGVAGVCLNCGIMPVRAGFSIRFHDNDWGLLESDDIANAIRYTALNGADIVSMSFGGSDSDLIIKSAIDYATALNPNLVLVAAAGNSGTNSKTYSYPAAYDRVIAVTATNNTGSKADFSNFGYWTDVAAPGVDIVSTVPKTGTLSSPTGYLNLSGTSMATPYISGVAGLLLSHNPNWTADQVERILKTGVDIPQETGIIYFGRGRTNVFKALGINRLSDATAAIKSPINEESIKDGIQVLGTASGDNYHLYYGKGIYPLEWTEIQSGSQVSDSLLGTLNINGLTDGIYTLKLVVIKAGLETDDYVRLKIERSLHAGWPKKLDIGQWGGLSDPLTPTLADITLDGIQDIVIHSNVREFVFKGDGTAPAGWPSEYKNPGYVTNGQLPGAAVGDLDKDHKSEVVTGLRTYEFGGTSMSCFNVYDHTGKYKPGWPVSCKVPGEDAYIMPLVIKDLDHDGDDEVIAASDNGDPNPNEPSSVVYVFNANGSNFERWPYSLDSKYFIPRWGSLGVADIDSDGKDEIVAVATSFAFPQKSYIYIWNYNGTLKPGYPILLKDYAVVQGGPVLADIDGDKKLEMPLFIDYGSCTAKSGKLAYFHLDGSMVYGWPQGFDNQFIANAPAVGDLDKDGKAETVFGTVNGCGYKDKVYVFDHDGSIKAGWPQPIESGMVWSQTTIGQIDKDDYPDVAVTTTSGLVYAWDRFGKIIPGFPKIMGFGGESSASGVAIGNVDEDPNAEMVASSQQGNVYVWDLESSSKLCSSWPQYQHDELHTAFYKTQDAPCTSPTTALKNGSFEIDDNNNLIPDGWNKGANINKNDIKTSVYAYDGKSSFKIVGNKTKNKTLSQTLNNGFSTGKTYFLSGWIKTSNAKEDKATNISAIVTFANNSHVQYKIPFPKGTYDWMKQSGSFKLDNQPISIKIRIEVKNQSGTIYFDNIEFSDQPPGSTHVPNLSPQPVSPQDLPD